MIPDKVIETWEASAGRTWYEGRYSRSDIRRTART